MNILKIVMIDSYKAVNCGIFAMNNIMTTDSNNEIDMKTESVDAFRFFIQRRFYG